MKERAVMNREARLRAELVAAGERLFRTGLIRGGEGNFSARLDAERFLLTPRGWCKGYLTAGDLLRVPLVGALPVQASSEGLLHQEILQRHQDVAAVLHAHPPNLLRAMRSGCALHPQALYEAQWLQVASVPEHPPGSASLAAEVAEAVGTACLVLLPRHGVVAVGGSVAEALWRLETAELLAFVLGKASP
ncbi:MAG: class II aldolase/adducin family protein [Thermoanaerobaculum sp.]|nr:class II aldolase/adducin family protein [Thermoanaerobaculum sp.]